MTVKAIAFYLPQFHPIPENDEWWGKGFTEWRKVTSARPLYENHCQPRVPVDLGYYDLRLPEVRKEQAELAASYGIHGFCYYYYWFGGKKLLNAPIEAMLASGEPSFPFCICWANENWTRRWDGRDDEILIDQVGTGDDPIRYIEDMIPFFRDPRYIRISGRPLLLVYRPELLQEPKRVTDEWRRMTRKEGLGDLFLVKCEHAFAPVKRPELQGFDASYEFPPHGFPIFRRTSLPPSGAAELTVSDYGAGALEVVNRPWPDYRLFRGVMLHWDNTPRRGIEGIVFDNFSPELYEWWLTETCLQTIERHKPEEQLIFINAWNEWGEGAYLEPDALYGHRNLQATKRALVTSNFYSELVRAQSENDIGGRFLAPEVGEYFRNQYNIIRAVSKLAFKRYEEWTLSNEANAGLSRHGLLKSPLYAMVYFLHTLAKPVLPKIRKVRVLDRVLIAVKNFVEGSKGGRRLDRSKSGSSDAESGNDSGKRKRGLRSSMRAAAGTKPETLLFISHDAGRTGAPILLLSLLKAMAWGMSFQKKVILRRGGALERKFRELADTLVLTGDGVKDRRLLQSFVRSCQVKLIYSNTVVNGDVLHLLAPHKIPVVTHVHELERGIASFAGNGLFSMTKWHSTHYVAASRAVMRNLVENHKIPESRISLVYEFIVDHGLTKGNMAAERKRMRAKLKIGTHDFVVVGCGTLDWRKGSDVFLDIAHQVVSGAGKRDVHFLWVGGAPEEQMLWEIRKRGLGDRLRLVGEVENALPYFCAADVFCLPSREDPFPLVCLEALSVGKPVVCFADAGGMPELVTDTCGLVVPYMDSPAMTEAILRLQKNADEYKKFSTAGMRVIREKHFAPTAGKPIRELLEKLMQNGSTPKQVQFSALIPSRGILLGR